MAEEDERLREEGCAGGAREGSGESGLYTPSVARASGGRAAYTVHTSW